MKKRSRRSKPPAKPPSEGNGGAVAAPAVLIDPIQTIEAALSDGISLTEDQKRRLQELVDSQREGGKLFLAALASARVKRVARFIGHMQVVEEQIFTNPNRVKNSETSTLVDLLSVLSNEVHRDADFIHKISEGDNLPGILKEFLAYREATRSKVESTITPDERDRVRAILSQLKRKSLPRVKG